MVLAEAAFVVELTVHCWIKHMLLRFEEEPPVTVYLAIGFAVATGRNPEVLRPDLGVVDAVAANALDANVLWKLPAPFDRFPNTVTAVANGDERSDLRAKPVY